METKLSVIIPCYNHGNYLSEALASIDNSLHRNQIEIIIINDGSTEEDTNRIVNELDPIKYNVINQENQGLARSRNNGILMAKAEYVLMLDADNFIEPAFLDDFFDFQKNGPEFDALYGNAQCFGDNKNVNIPGNFDVFRISRGNYIDACAIFNKKKIFSIGLYDENMPNMGLEDWELWVRLGMSNAIIIYVEKTYYHYRVLNNSMIRTAQKDSLQRAYQYIYNKNLIKIETIETSIENYINRSLSFKVIINLLLKKFKLRKDFKFHISKLSEWM